MNKTKTLLLVFLFINYGFAQVCSEYMFKNDWEKYNLKGNVKALKLALKITNDKLWEKNLFLKYNPLFQNYDAKDDYDRNLFFQKFNTYGIMTEHAGQEISNLNEEITQGNILKFEIDSIDFINKQKIAKQYNFPFELNPNKSHSYKKSKTTHKYEYKIENQKIAEESYFDEYTSEEFPEETPKLDRKTLFFYNSTGQINKKDIIIPEDEYNDNKTETYYDQEIYNGNTLEVHYVYNKKNQLIKITVYKNKEFLYQESFMIENDKLIEMEKLVESKYTHNEFDTNKTVYKYDDSGNVTNLTYYDNNVGEEVITSIKFEYTFDNNKNWILCKMYLNEKSETPDAIAERKVEYFNN